MTTSTPAPIPPSIEVPNPIFEAEVDRRANRLCAAAEPHIIGASCLVHRAEARRQLTTAWEASQKRTGAA